MIVVGPMLIMIFMVVIMLILYMVDIRILIMDIHVICMVDVPHVIDLMYVTIIFHVKNHF